VSVFGTLENHRQGQAILAGIGAAAGVALPTTKPAAFVCEDRSHVEVLNERGGRAIPTSPDVLVRWPGYVVVVESKFREGLGHCSQTRARRTKSRGTEPAPCTGDHAPGSDRKTGSDAACRLTVPDGRREPRLYWQVAERLFRPEVLEVPRRPCPFVDGRYQLMRNLTFASEFARRDAAFGFGFIVAYVAASPSATHTEKLIEQFREMLLPDAAEGFGAVSYEAISEIVEQHGDHRLAAWLRARLTAGLAATYPLH
jgi:hypothetical protein